MSAPGPDRLREDGRLPICVTCGVQRGGTVRPAVCPVCSDARQYVGWEGQGWTTLDELRGERSNRIDDIAPGLVGVGTTPSFAIGQRAVLVRTPAGNVLWDCIALLDDATLEALEDAGGVAAIAVSHPHFHGSLVTWARALEAPAHLHAADRGWLQRPDPAVSFWEGDTLELLPGVTLHRLGGHFPGATVLHWEDGAEGRGVLLSSDVVAVAQDRRWVSFMWSFPNYIPLSAVAVARIAARLEPLAFERLYGGWWGGAVTEDAAAAVQRSAARYLAALEAPP